ncbi:homogentisate 1,2-dioxygenase [Sphingomonadaceae bacterium jetA1]|jgi:hypothetical protein|uniref:homogentisate 1,2-dioxygenase n=1 Tax=Facivitalis istanbulensis TaxID=3075838 RepID=UPI0034697929
MRHALVAAWAGILAIAPASAIHAQQPGPACPAGATTLPPELGGWAARRPVRAAGNASGLGAATLVIGSAVDATLQPTGRVAYVIRPEKPGGSVSHGGLFSFRIERAGTYRVALGSGAWIDILRGRTMVASTAHGHGPDCSGIRKMVDFPLTPGRYTLQIAANATPDIALMVARLP